MSDRDAPLDQLDAAIMRHLAALHAIVDPPPTDLDERVLFAIDLDDLDMEVARQSTDLPVASGARAHEDTRTITFDADSRTIMLTVAEQADGLLRIDGWLAPAAAVHVELRLAQPETSRSATANETGRFVLHDVPHGLAQLVVHAPAGRDGPGVVTGSFWL